jgi:hypothetical protein
LGDPLFLIAAPASKPAEAPAPVHYAAGASGCPATVTDGCDVYLPGAYSGGITAKGTGSTNKTALFAPGVYWIENQFQIDTNSCVRPTDSTFPGDGSGGTIFYFADITSIDVKGGGGQNCVSAGMPAFDINTVKCDSASQIPGNLIGTTFTGTVLLAPCTGDYGDPQGVSNPSGMQRGVLFFQNRAKKLTGGGAKPPNWSGGGNFLLAGGIYLHQCTTGGGADVGGMNCDRNSAYKTHFTFSSSGSNNGVLLGNIASDHLTVGGNLVLDVVSGAGYRLLKASLIR